ncbi:MAG TPA: hypothetical protein VMH81_12565 [Bryobacteraceae bacterium]|nr:hypothetical protein [Bryobacteraceae bacterium]
MMLPPVPEDAEERLLKLIADSPLNDEPLTEEQGAAVDRLMRTPLTPEEEAELDREFPEFREPN